MSASLPIMASCTCAMGEPGAERADVCHGVLIPQRPPQRFGFMQGYGVLAGLLHDIGMVDFSALGRRYASGINAAQAVLTRRWTT